MLAGMLGFECKNSHHGQVLCTNERCSLKSLYNNAELTINKVHHYHTWHQHSKFVKCTQKVH